MFHTGFHVIWNEMLKFKVQVPELAMLQFTVREGNDSFLGQYALPLSCIQQGIEKDLTSLYLKSAM
jgi:hypothetical protein